MSIREMVTQNYPKNVGTPDRIFRIASGIGLLAAGWALPVPLVATVLMSIAGAMWAMTGVLSRCNVYYLLGMSTIRSEI